MGRPNYLTVTIKKMRSIELTAESVVLQSRSYNWSISTALVWTVMTVLCGLVMAPCYGQVGKSQEKHIRILHSRQGNKVIYGKASHYSRSLDGSKTAIGTIYKNDRLTAASNFFKLRTWVKVTRLSNGRSVIVYINDRMHPAMADKGRIIDLSVAAAEALHFASGVGITRVKVEQVENPDETQDPIYSNQGAPLSVISEYDR